MVALSLTALQSSIENLQNFMVAEFSNRNIIIYGVVDPTVSPGIVATIGSYYLNTATVPPTRYEKTDNTNTGWTPAASGGSGSVSPATATPLMDGTAAVGASLLYARQDHVHPSDSSKANLAGSTSQTFNVANATSATQAMAYGQFTAYLGVANGVATLDSSGKVTSSQLPASIVGGMNYQGTWNASTNTPTLASSTGTTGYFYKVSVAGTTTLNGISVWNVGDFVLFDGTVWDKIDGIPSEVVTVAGRVGAVVLSISDISGAAPLVSPAFTGTPTSVTPAVNDNSTNIATTAFVVGQAATVAPLIDGTATVGTSVLFARQDHVHPNDSSKANLASPAFTGTPTSTTPAVNDNSLKIATTAFVLGQAATATPLMDGTVSVGTSVLFARQDHVHPNDSSKANLASPAFTGTPTSTTPAVNDNSTNIATTAFVVGQAATVAPLMDGTVSVGTSLFYARQDHVHASDNSKANISGSTSQTFNVANATSATQAMAYGQFTSQLGVANGVATLDSGGHILASQIPVALVGAMNYQGTWNASTNTPTLVSGTGTKGFYYKVSVAGTTTLDGISVWNVGDFVLFDGTTWDKIDGITSEVVSVAGRTGVVTLSVTDISGAAPLASPTFTGTPTAPTAAVSTNTTQLATTAFVLAQAATATPLVDGTAAVGTSLLFARQDHVHPNDTTKANLAGSSSQVFSVANATSATQAMAYGQFTSQLGVASGVATLDASGHVPLSQLPTTLAGALNYQGTWNASTNTPTITSGVGTKGYYWVVSVAGTTTIDTISQWNVGDWIVFNGATYNKVDGLTSEVISVAGRTGAVVLAVADVSGAAPLASPAFTGTPTSVTPAVNDNSTNIATTAYYVGQASTSAPLINGTATVGTSLLFSRQDHVHPTDTTRAALAGSSTQTFSVANATTSTQAMAYGQFTSQLGVANGVATLNASGYVPASQLPSAISGGLQYEGTWNASTNTPTLASGTGTKGYFYKVSVAGTTTLDGISSWNVGDMVLFDGTVWDKLDGSNSSGSVTSVAGRTGAVVLSISDISGGAPLASPTFTGTPAAPTAAANTNTTQLATTAFVVGQAATATPLIDGTAAVGTSLLYARQDHVHPNDTTKANLASPAFTGTPTSTTPAVNDNSTNIATTAFVVGQAATATPLIDGTATVGTSLLYARQDHVHPTDTTRAALAGSTSQTFSVANATTSTQAMAYGQFTSVLGVASGVATLDATGKVTSSQLPASIVGALNYQGTWNASTNTPTLVSGTGTKGFYYKVSVAGTTTIDTISQWNVGDLIAFDGTVWDKIDGVASEVLSVAGRTGAVVLAVADVSGAAPLASPTFTGTPTSTTPAVNDNSTNIATTAFVVGQAATVAPLIDGTATVGTSLLYARQDHIHPSDTSKANLASPAFTGTPAAPTAAANTNTTQIATTAFVVGQAGTATPLIDGTAAVGTSLLFARQDHVHPTDTTRAALAGSTSQTFSVANATLGTQAMAYGQFTSQLGVASGVATLDATGKVPTSQLPAAVIAGMSYQGTWNASTNTPTLASGTGTKGYFYKVSVAGTTTIDTISNWNVGDFILFDGTVWDKIDGIPSEVLSVAGRTGAVVLAVADVSGAAPLASPAFTGTPTSTTPAVNDNSTNIATTAYYAGQAGTATPLINGTATVGTSLLFSRQDHVHPTDTTRAALAGSSTQTFSVANATTSTQAMAYGQFTSQLGVASGVATLTSGGVLTNAQVPGYNINAQTGTTYTAVLTDANNIVTMNNASANTFTIPLNSSVAYPVGTTIGIYQLGAGQTTIAATSGVTLNNSSSVTIRAQNACVHLLKIATDTWQLTGDLT